MKLLALAALVLASAPAFANSNAELYNSLPGEGTMVGRLSEEGDRVLGVSIREKSDGSLLCQKRGAVVPRPVYGYSCYARGAEGAAAEAAYEESSAPVFLLELLQQGIPLIGTTVREKKTATGFCRKSTPVVAHPTASYTCFDSI